MLVLSPRICSNQAFNRTTMLSLSECSGVLKNSENGQNMPLGPFSMYKKNCSSGKNEHGTTKFVSYQCNQYTNIQSKCNAAREFLTGMMCIFSAKDFCLFLCLSFPCGRINDLCGSNRLVGSCAYTQHWADISVVFAGKLSHVFFALDFFYSGK